MKRTLSLAALAAASSLSFGQLLYSNGPMVTHPGQGAGGADVSMASGSAATGPNSGGGNTREVPAGGHPDYFMTADDFTIAGAPWVVNRVDMFAYETNATTPAWTATRLDVYSGTPGAGGSVIATFSGASVSYTNINRVFNGTGNLLSTARRVHRLSFNTGSLNLAAGSYWVALQVDGGTSGWNPYVMDPNPANPNDPITRRGNARQFRQPTTGVFQWEPEFTTTTGWNDTPEHPFEVYGTVVPEPASMAALGLGALALLRRRRK